MRHPNHSEEHWLTRTGARVLLVAAAVMFAGAVVHFAFTAFESRQCYTESPDTSLSQDQRRLATVNSNDCRRILASSEQHQRTDAAIAILAIIVAIGAAIRLSKATRQTKRVVLAIEIAVVAVGVFYTILLATILR